MTTTPEALAVADGRCACVSHDAGCCYRIRYGVGYLASSDYGPTSDREQCSEYDECDCSCHYEDFDDEHE